jgi:actin related protein 2/3 complex subunit 2
MIILECESAIIRNLLERSLDPAETLSETYNCCDFDGVKFIFKVERPKKKKSDDDEKKIYPVHIEMNLPCWEAIKEYGAEDRYNELYGAWKVDPSEGFTHALTIDLGPMNDAERKNAITLAARLKANMLGAPFLWVAQKHEAKENFAPFEIPYRKTTGESMYVCPADKGATVIFTIRFSDPGDHTIGNVFLNELQAARTRVSSAPSVTTSPKAPKDLETFDLPDDVRDGKMFAFVSISLLDPQLSQRKRVDTSYYIPLFRDYIHYHIKCTKAFLHQKMRLRAAHLLKILDEAKPEPKVKVYRTVTGKVVGK